MGKIVKYCGACEESFAERFGFCPNCGGTLRAFEMNPVQEETKVSAEKTAEAEKASDIMPEISAPENNVVVPAMSLAGIYETSPKMQPAVVTAFSADGNSTNGTKADDVQPPLEKTVSEEPTVKAKETEVSEREILTANDSVTEVKPLAATAAAGTNGNGHYKTASQNFQPTKENLKSPEDGGFHVTVIEEKNSGQRNMLLLGSMFLMLSLVTGGVVYSLFNKDLLVGAIDAGNPFYITPIEDLPIDVEDEQPKPKIEKDAGGGGGGGNKNPDPVTKGVPPTQVDKPVAPLMMVPKMTNPDIKIVNQTQGTIVRPPTNEQVGLQSGLTSDRLSSGGGDGGGFGNGRGSGAGNGRGTGEGNGIGSGSGNGNGNGNGNGSGSGNEGRGTPPPPPPVKVGVTEPFKLISKPKPSYTDAARQNQITGTVRLRVIFSASGEVGSISPVSGLPYGLTEQAIAAARQIRFEPAKKNGVAVASQKIIEYTFTIY